MKKRIAVLLIVLLSSLLLCSCDIPLINQQDSSSTFSIEFINVGQGDSALVECDGRYMLIDGGGKTHGKDVYKVLEEKQVQHLDILAISHFHMDHVGGLLKALDYAQNIDRTIANTNEINNNIVEDEDVEVSDISSDSKYADIEAKIIKCTKTNRIDVPYNGEEFKLGSAKVEVVDVSSKEENDSLILLITYGKTKFLFTGDAENDQQYRIIDKYHDEPDGLYKIDLIKMPHHGSFGKPGIEYPIGSLLKVFMPKYAVISVGENNRYEHPAQKTLDALDQKEAEIYRTDKNGNILVKSDGKEIQITTEK